MKIEPIASKHMKKSAQHRKLSEKWDHMATKYSIKWLEWRKLTATNISEGEEQLTLCYIVDENVTWGSYLGLF